MRIRKPIQQRATKCGNSGGKFSARLSPGWRIDGQEQRERMDRKGAKHRRKPSGQKKRKPAPKKCRKIPAWVGLPNGLSVRLADANGLYCGQTEKRHDGKLIALCEKCRVRL